MKNLIFVLLFVSSLIFAQTTDKEKLPLGAVGEKQQTADEKKTLHVLKAMSVYLQNIQQFVVDMEVSYEQVIGENTKLLFEKTVKIYLQRPNKFRAFGPEREFVYDGKQLSLLLADSSTYAQTNITGNIAEVIDFMADKLDVSVPVADLLVHNPYESYTKGAKTTMPAMYIGIDEVRGIPCHHLAFFFEGINWQLWVEDGEMLVPRKFHMVYKTMPAKPHYTVVFTKWNICRKLPDLVFEFEPPVDGEKVEFLTSNDLVEEETKKEFVEAPSEKTGDKE